MKRLTAISLALLVMALAIALGCGDDRIAQVESGLLPPLAIAGQPPSPMNLVERMEQTKTPGVSVALIQGGEIAWAKGYGVLEASSEAPVTTGTLFQAASISKPVSALAALRLVEAGQLDLDEDVNTKLRSWTLPGNELTAVERVTLRRILSHSAGLTVHGFPGYAAGSPVPTLVQILDGNGPANSQPIRVDMVPGTGTRYSGGGYCVMQQLMVDVAGGEFRALMRELVLELAGMNDSLFGQPLPEELQERAARGHTRDGSVVEGRWHTYPELAAAGLWTTPSDLARLAVAVYEAYQGVSNAVISQAMARQMLSNQGTGRFGLGFVVVQEEDQVLFQHGGANAGFRCFVSMNAHTGNGIAVMSNSDNGSILGEEISRGAAKVYGWPGYPVREKEVVAVNPAIYADYVGRYELTPEFVLIASVEDGKLFIQAPGQSRARLYPESEVKFFAMESGVPEITFLRDAEGRVTGLHAQGQEARRLE